MKLLIIEQKDVLASYEKLKEEYKEFLKELMYDGTEEDTLAEGMDLLQATYSLLLIMTNYDLDKLEEANKKHIAKLLGRGHVVAGGVGIEGVQE